MKNFVYSIVALVAIAIIAIAIVLNPGDATAEPLTKVTVSEVTHSVFYAPQYVAINLGFFEEEGLEIELINSGGADKVMTALLANQVDIGFSGPEAAIYVYNEGKADYAEIFAQLTKRDGSFLMAREPAEDFKWSDLVGSHVLPGRKGGVPYMTFEYVLKHNGVDPATDLLFDNSISFNLMTSAFTAGTGDYVTVFEPAATAIQNEGKGYIVASIGEASGEIPYTAYYAKKSFIQKNPELIQKFVNAIYKGQVWIQESSSTEIAEVLLPSFPDSDVAVLTQVVERYREIDAWNKTPYMTEESFNLLQTVMTEAGELSTTAPYDAIVNNSFAENVK